ncbi:FAD-dependent oxidoreductase, partial [Nonomuraea rhizosphaerae]|uniref:FAD-dependent oxidoreductase n=1 Tax=Nonomuraea rhizosphaerae TaxID=2665663 RepID=UPI001C5EE197
MNPGDGMNAHDAVNGTYDLVVIGGGPAGVAGALTAALHGLRVALLDSGIRLGGQYFRHAAEPTAGGAAGDTAGGAAGGTPRDTAGGTPGLRRFLRQAGALRERADVLLGHQVWSVTRDGGHLAAHCRTPGGRVATVRCRDVLIATGAHDRSLPFPGWDLPGVLTAGGAQALLKGDGVVAGGRVVGGGTGP